jgi:hypothetical protein
MAKILPLTNLEHGFCAPALTQESKAAIFYLPDRTRFEVMIRGATSVFIASGPRLERHRFVIAPSGGHADVEFVQVHSLMELVGMPELARAIAFYTEGRLEDAARYATAAGRRGAALIRLIASGAHDPRGR